MKSIGIIRNIDELGRVVIPIEIRKNLNIKEKDPLEICVEHNSIILKKKNYTCSFCNTRNNLEEFNFKYICKSCKKKLLEKEIQNLIC